MSLHWYLFDQGVYNGIDEIKRLDVTSRREAITAASLAWGRLSPRMQDKRDEFYVALIDEHFGDADGVSGVVKLLSVEIHLSVGVEMLEVVFGGG